MSITLDTGYNVFESRAACREIHPDLALLLTTSGSTGDPKLVRLTYSNATSNALSIAQYLEIGPGETAAQSLPVYYSYGLSVIHSHLVAGGTVLLTRHSFMRPEFWNEVDRYGSTSFAGVPHMYETLKRLRFDVSAHPSLRTMTQAGGRLGDSFIEWYSQAALHSGRRFYVMYGQTEATARISYVPPDVLPEKIGSIGVPIPGGDMRLSRIDDDGGLEEIVYSGPNVMMGYADGPDALARGDELSGVLRTGDLGRVDRDGFFYVCGRLKRFAKLFGKRVNLADVEASVESRYSLRAAAVDTGRDHLMLCLESSHDIDERAITFAVAEELGIPPNAVRTRRVSAIPMTSSGKKDYAAVAQC